MRKKIVAGNWKMNTDIDSGLNLASEIDGKLENNPHKDVEVIICAPFTHIKSITDSTGIIKSGAQNCSSEESGAFTGEISAGMIKSVGAEYVIIGHSERRAYFTENDELLSKKVRLALNNNLKVIFCIGESLDDREAGNHFLIVEGQLRKGIFNLPGEEFLNCIIAYEPVWAIGTGVTASTDQAQEIHSYIRDLIKDKYGKKIADSTSILYGGSCNAKNAEELFSMSDVDGGLIGGASLKPNDFLTIINSY